MPKRTDIHKILIIGSGPIVIGQACEFDYSGTQACRALKQEGYRVILVNSNPATIMTDPEISDRTYIEPTTPEMVEKIIAVERPDALLPTLGGQTGLNIAMALAETGVLEKYGVELIGAKLPAIKKAESRLEFKAAMERIGLEVPRSGYAKTWEEARHIIHRLKFPVIIRPSFTLGGSGGNFAYNMEEFEANVQWGLSASPRSEILIEESVRGWKEYELEVMRDRKNNVVIVCTIENFDPMGVHTGDSITVAPAQTLTDKEYQMMRDASIAIMQEIGVETGGSNIQFAVEPDTGRMMVIEMNPRVSRSSALASKATGFPIAKIAAKLAVGYTLDEIPNDITRKTPACFEPTIDYCVVKFPRFAFDKFPKADQTLTSQMKSVGEVMAIGRTFKEAMGKALRSLEIDRSGLRSVFLPRSGPLPETNSVAPGHATGGSPVVPGQISGGQAPALQLDMSKLRQQYQPLLNDKLHTPNWERIWYIADAMRLGMTNEEIFRLTWIDPWFLENLRQMVELDSRLRGMIPCKEKRLEQVDSATLRRAKQYGFADTYLAEIWDVPENQVRQLREGFNIKPVYKLVDTCAAEFEAYTPYLYSTYESECEANPSQRKKIMILGSGPNRIGQGIEFDYCCVHAVMALKEDGYETIMVNCNPETVSTDYDISDRLYFEPLTLEDILSIVDKEKPDGVIVQLGGQTPLKLAKALEANGVKIIGTSPDNIDRAEDRERFWEVMNELELNQPPSATGFTVEDARAIAGRIGYPILVRPSYVLGGRAMKVVYDEQSLEEYVKYAIEASGGHPILIDKFLEDAKELDVDAIADGERVIIGGVMEHIEEAGIHSGDSACSLPPYSIPKDIIAEICRQTKLLAEKLQVRGLINVQFAVQHNKIFILEVNPRASRTIPFVSKAIGVPLAKIAARVMAGKSLAELGFVTERVPDHISVKEAVFPFVKFPGVDPVLGPEMRSTGEVMGLDDNFPMAFAKAQAGAGSDLPSQGQVILSVKDEDKLKVITIAKELSRLGFTLLATRGTYQAISSYNIPVQLVQKVSEGRPHIVDLIKNGQIAMLLNTPEGKHSHQDSFLLRRSALVYNIPYFTTISGASAAVAAIKAMRQRQIEVKPLQEYNNGKAIVL